MVESAMQPNAETVNSGIKNDSNVGFTEVKISAVYVKVLYRKNIAGMKWVQMFNIS